MSIRLYNRYVIERTSQAKETSHRMGFRKLTMTFDLTFELFLQLLEAIYLELVNN